MTSIPGAMEWMDDNVILSEGEPQVLGNRLCTSAIEHEKPLPEDTMTERTSPEVKRKSMSGHQLPVRGATDVWLTPPEIIAALGPFDLDPCAAVGQPWPTAAKHYTIEDDGLAQKWEGFVWLNPPFGPEVETWFKRLAEHGNGIGLCAARTETKWFERTIWKRADAVLFMRGRPYFYRPDGTRGHANSGVPICLVGYGEVATKRLMADLVEGWTVTYWERQRVS